MIDVIENVDKLIDTFKSTDFVKNMYELKSIINNNNLINSSDVRKLYNNSIIHKYVENQNILDMHIYYLNKEINKLIDDKVCHESN